MRKPKPRVLMVSHRFLRPHVSWASAYEFEDVVCAVDDVDLIAVEPVSPKQLPLEDKVLSRLRRQVGIAISREPGRTRTTVTNDYDVFFVRVMTPQGLDILDSIDGWQDRCRIKICWIEELWVDMLRYTKLLKPLELFDHVFVGHAPTPAPLAKLVDRPCSFLAPAVDALRFCSHPNPPSRSIDVYALGRRSPVAHRKLLERAEREPRFNYFYDSARWTTFVEGHAEHRQLTANLIKRSRYFMADRAKVNEPDQTKGAQVFGPRFFEGAAAGSVLIGEPPDCDTFRAFFDWPDAVIHFPYGSDKILAVIDELDANPERVGRARRANMTNVLRRHDWSNRWRTVLETIGLDSTTAAEERSHALARRAQEVEEAH
ncbi:MAG: glycosyltransferase [Polyangiales bacterium]